MDQHENKVLIYLDLMVLYCVFFALSAIVDKLIHNLFLAFIDIHKGKFYICDLIKDKLTNYQHA